MSIKLFNYGFLCSIGIFLFIDLDANHRTRKVRTNLEYLQHHKQWQETKRGTSHSVPWLRELSTHYSPASLNFNGAQHYSQQHFSEFILNGPTGDQTRDKKDIACCASCSGITGPVTDGTICTGPEGNVGPCIVGPTVIISEPGHYCLSNDINGGLPDGVAIIIQNTNNVELDLNLHTIDLQGVGTIGILIQNSQNVTIENGRIINTAQISGSEAGIQIVSSTKVNVLDVLFDTYSVGILIDDASQIEIKQSSFNNGVQGIETFSNDGVTGTTGLLIDDIKMFNNAAGITLLPPIYDVTIQNSMIDTFSLQGIFLGLALPNSNTTINNCQFSNGTIAVPGSPSIGIDVFFSENNVVISNCGFANMDYGITLFDAFSTLLFNNVIRNITFDGIGIVQSKNVTIDNNSVFDALQAPLNITISSNVLVQNSQFLTVSGTGFQPTGLSVAAAVSATTSYDIAMRNCTLGYFSTSNLCNGLRLRNCGGFQCENCTIETNGRGGDGVNGNGILIYGQTTSSAFKNCLVTNRTPNHAGNGVGIIPDLYGSASGIVFDGCTIDGALNNGFDVEQGTNITVSNSVIQNTLVGNGILFKGTNSSINGNTIATNAGVGLKNQGGKSNAIYKNLANHNGTNYQGVSLVVAGNTPRVGQLENVSH